MTALLITLFHMSTIKQDIPFGMRFTEMLTDESLIASMGMPLHYLAPNVVTIQEHIAMCCPSEWGCRE